ncbi:hypothetical protein EGW08_023653 [Elysia chlorotica]|uniref:EGF-like domain-containing protein n=1 Tax=Elysia chlorotica TaxID=188477 RepID=A0A433SIA1_ELYCH|nr:hypothetical protein EGW08_023653 [Elysia chlorotica]
MTSLIQSLQSLTTRVQALEAARNGGSASSGNQGNSGSGGLSGRSFRRLRNRVRTLERTMQSIQTLLTTDECDSNPCLNGGTCIDMYNGYICRCPSNFQGPQCTQDVNECVIYAGTDLGCQNGATCFNTHGGYTCHCTSNYHGIHCRETHDDCTGASPMELCGHGVCVNVARPVAGHARYRCICDEGWTTSGSDPACTQDVNECNGHTHCSMDPPVMCVNIPGSYTCGSCPAGQY